MSDYQRDISEMVSVSCCANFIDEKVGSFKLVAKEDGPYNCRDWQLWLPQYSLIHFVPTDINPVAATQLEANSYLATSRNRNVVFTIEQ